MWTFAIFGLFVASALAEEVCYEPCGCFSDDPPFDDRPLPESPEDQVLIWRLYNMDNITDGWLIDWDNIPDEYDPDKPTKYLIHGWLSNPDMGPIDGGIGADNNEIKDAFLENGYDYNVIVVDWTIGARGIYAQAASNTRVVGSCTGYLASVLQPLPLGHCIGHSLGGQTCGYMGKFTNGDMGRATGLDPAGSLFENTQDESVYLNKDDADYVDTIHTSSASGGIFEEAVADVDIYPHKGGQQPPCERPGGQCDHWSCTHYYLASIVEPHESCSFLSYPCDTYDDADAGVCNNCGPDGDECQSMGYHSDQYSARGTFYLEVDPEYPYCQN